MVEGALIQAPKIHNRVRLLRRERGVSRKELARALGLNHRTVGYIEREQYRVKLEHAYAIANFFELPLGAVFSDEPFTPMSEQLYGPPHEEEGGGDE